VADLRLKFATQRYDRMEPIFDGTVKPEGVTLDVEESFPAHTFERLFAKGEFDVAEIGLTFYLRSLEMTEPPFVAIPVFPSRTFRHSAVYVNANAGIREPKDIVGKRHAEVFTYGHDAGVWPKGILKDRQGVPYNAHSGPFYIGGVDRPWHEWWWLPIKPPEFVRAQHIGEARTLGDMLEKGEIDVLYSTVVPPTFRAGSKNIRRLFEDGASRERQYYRDTGIFPIMHAVAIRRPIYEKNRWLAASLFKAFDTARAKVLGRYAAIAENLHSTLSLPLATEHFHEMRKLMGEDYWPYGIAKNRKCLETFVRYHHEQGISKKVWKLEEIFAPESLSL
jgi:4,5-dihydroxyphthalate decarboxylase